MANLWKMSGEVKSRSLVEDLTGYYLTMIFRPTIMDKTFDEIASCSVCHCRACVVVDDRLFVIGGQEGDFMAKPGSPIFKCSRRMEVLD